MTGIEWGLLSGLGVLNLLLLALLLLRKPAAPDHTAMDRLAQELRREIADSARTDRQELATSFATFQRSLVQQSAEATRTQNTQIDAFAQQLALLQKTLSDTLSTQLQALGESNARRIGEVRATLESQKPAWAKASSK